MYKIWHEAELNRPPLITLEVKDAAFVESLHRHLRKLMQQCRSESTEFSQTAALLSRVIARRKNSFRRMTGFRDMLKLNAATCRLLRTDLPRDLASFGSALPDVAFGNEAIALLPTRDYLDFILVRLLTVHSIHRRINECCEAAALYFKELLRATTFVDTCTLFIAILAKLRKLNALLLNNNADIYLILREQRKRFPINKQITFLPTSTKLPKTLENIELTELQKTDTDAAENASMITQPTVTIKKSVPKLLRCVDVGTEVARKQPTSSKKKFNIESLQTIEDVKNFIAIENKARIESRKLAVTQSIPNNLWTGAEKIFKRKLIAGEQKKALNLFIKFLNTNLENG